MRKQLTILSGVLAAWAVCSAPAYAFQETQVSPEPSLSMSNLNGNSLALDLDATDPKAADEGSENKLKFQEDGTLQILPKLNFGLDVMYGSPDDDGPIAHAAPVQEYESSDSVRILGTLKRRF
jgi:hypothetical protein